MTTRRLTAILASDVVGFSTMMERDEEGTLTRMKTLQSQTIEPRVATHSGRIVKTMGDGFLIEFASPFEAFRCATEIQEEINRRDADPDPIKLRMGVNLGDVLVDDDGDIFGDDVNLATRLQALADPGGIVISSKVFDEIVGKGDWTFQDRGKHQVKNITRPIRVYAFRSDASAHRTGLMGRSSLKQEIKYCRSTDGVRIAWAKAGQGPVLVKAANYMNHLEYDWESPVWRHVLEGLARDNTLIRYDARGNGLSDWDVGEVSVEAFVADLEAVVEASGVGRFPLLGVSQGAAIAIAYAVRHPERVSHLIFYGGFARGGRKRSPEERERRDAMQTLIRLGWGGDDPGFRQLFTSRFIPGGTKEQIDWFNELQRRTTSPECAERYFRVVGDIDVVDLLPQVTAPTLVMHVRDDRICPIEAGRELAAKVRGARLVVLPGENHLFLEDEPAADRFFEEIRLFLGD